MNVVVKNGICRGLVGEIVSSENKNIIFRTKIFGVETDLNLKKWMLDEEAPNISVVNKGFAVETVTQTFKETCTRAREDVDYKKGWADINIAFVRLSKQEYEQRLFDLKLDTLRRITGGVLLGVVSVAGEELDFFSLDEELQKKFIKGNFL